MKQKIIAGNWKMNATKSEAIFLIEHLIEYSNLFQLSDNKKVIIAPPFTYLQYCINSFKSIPHLHVAAQNCSEHKNGAFTGEISSEILKSLEVDFVIIGHSERRQYFNETDAILLQKTKEALENKLQVIYCCGETLEIRENNNYIDFIIQQLKNTVFTLPETEFENIIIAYEPIWAIGTGKTASKAQAEEVHLAIRNAICENYNVAVSNQTSILYGGSVNAKNAADLFSSTAIDGALVGGASLKINDFIDIINAMQ